jgi:hypothetical protein
VLCRIKRLGINIQLTAVWQLEANLKKRLAGTQREIESVAVLFLLRDRIGLERLAAGGFRGGIDDVGSVGKIELEILIVQLGTRRSRSVVHREQPGALQLISLCLEAQDVSSDTDVRELFGNVEYLHFDRVRSRRRHTVIRHPLVNGANQVWASVREFEGKVTAGVGLGVGRFFHSLGQFDQYDVVTGCGLAGGSVGERAIQSLS